MSIMIWQNGRYYNNAFYNDNKKLKMALMDESVLAKWEKRNSDASPLFQDVTTHQDFIRKVTRVNVFPMIFSILEGIEDDEIFECKVFDGNEAWVGEDDVEFRYFTRKSPKHIAIGYTIIDFLKAFHLECDVNSAFTFLMTRKELVNLLNVSYEESDWEKAEERKYENNLHLLKKLKGKRSQKQFPYLHKELGVFLPTLEKILKNGMRFINPKKKDKNGYSSFVFYSRYSGLSKEDFEEMVKKFKTIDLIIVEKKQDTYFDKSCCEYVTEELTFFSFPSYSDGLFNEIEEKLMGRKKE